MYLDDVYKVLERTIPPHITNYDETMQPKGAEPSLEKKNESKAHALFSFCEIVEGYPQSLQREGEWKVPKKGCSTSINDGGKGKKKR